MPWNSEGLEDFSAARLLPAAYSGSDEKYTVQMDGAWWMLKFGSALPPDKSKPPLGSYNNAPISEHIACQVANLIGIKAQETRLGTYRGRLVVACRDFVRNTDIPSELIEFSKLENSTEGAPLANRKTPEYGFTMRILKGSPFLEPIRDEAISRFWQTLCLDALVGNHDRHASNWGYLADRSTMVLYACAPVYDCASSLCPMLAESQMEPIMSSRETHRNRVLGRPKARLLVNGQRMRYGDFLCSELGTEARMELTRLFEKIDLGEISKLVWSTPAASETYRRFICSEIALRKSLLLEPAYKLAKTELAAAAKACDIEAMRAISANPTLVETASQVCGASDRTDIPAPCPHDEREGGMEP